jgi:hypothetical protein
MLFQQQFPTNYNTMPPSLVGKGEHTLILMFALMAMYDKCGSELHELHE